LLDLLIFLILCFIAILGAWYWFFANWNCQRFYASIDLSFCTRVQKVEIQSFESCRQFDIKSFPNNNYWFFCKLAWFSGSRFSQLSYTQSNKGMTLPQPLSRTPYNSSVIQRYIKVACWLSCNWFLFLAMQCFLFVINCVLASKYYLWEIKGFMLIWSVVTTKQQTWWYIQ
jgi:hypothetical protein